MAWLEASPGGRAATTAAATARTPATGGALARWLAQAGWWVPLPSLGAAPELGGYDGGGDGAHTHNGGALAWWLAQAGWWVLLPSLGVAPELVAAYLVRVAPYLVLVAPRSNIRTVP
eukprot:COSAG01_NODE_47188_length_392_cov_17.211604_1_plen_117_part_10